MYYKLSCPVPKKQRPINEYMELVDSPFFNGPLQKQSVFFKEEGKTLCWLFLFCLPFSFFFFNFNDSWTQLILVNTECASFFLCLGLLRRLLAWTYVKKRLYNAAVFYEESGWYDGRVWVKPKNILLQDRLIYTYQVVPATKSLSQAFLGGILWMAFLYLLFLFN